MVKVIKTYRQQIPAIRFIGKKYQDKDRVNGTFSKHWGDWFTNGWFEVLEKNSSSKADFEDSDAYIGLMRYKKGEPFEYWIGMFFSANTEVPTGFSFVDFDAASLGVSWLYGKEYEVYGKENLCAESCLQAGYKIVPDDKGAYWFFERFGCPRFTTPDENGNIILDICYFIESN